MNFPLPLRGRQWKSAQSAIGRFKAIVMNINQLSSKIIGAAIQVHKALGPGLLESAYEECISHELSSQGLSIERQKPLAINYKGIKLDCGYRLDIVAENKKYTLRPQRLCGD
jgi:hypothetical protein